MKTKFLYALGAILLGVALFPFSASSAEPAPITVQKRGDGSSIMLGAGVQAPLLVIGTAPTGAGVLRIASGGTLDIQAGAIVNFPTGFIPWAAVNKTGSSLLDLATRSAGDLSTGTLLVARLPAFSGDASTSAGSSVLTLATVNANVGQFAQVTVNGKGLVTAAGNLSGDLTTSGAVATLATVASGATTGSSTAIPVITFNNKGLVTAVTTAAVIAPAGTLTGTTLAANVVTSSLTSVGTLTGGATGAGFTVNLGTSTISGLLLGVNGGTGVNNSGKTITLGGNWTSGGAVTWSGGFAFTGTLTNTTSVTFPVSGTLATTAGTVASVQGTAGQILANGLSTPAQTGAVILTLPTAVTGVNSVTSVALSGLTLATGTFGNAATFASATGDMNVVSTTASSSSSTGALVVGSAGNGGLGVLGKIFAGNDVNTANNFVASSAAGTSIRLTTTGATGAGAFVRIDSTTMGGKTWNIRSSGTTDTAAVGVLSFEGTGSPSTLQLTPTAVNVIPSTASSSTTTGALTVAGGVGVAGRGTFGSLSAPGTGANSETFGDSSASSAIRSVAVGKSAVVNGDPTHSADNVVVGYQAIAGSASVDYFGQVVVGMGASGGQSGSTVIGYGATANGSIAAGAPYGIAIGRSSVTTGGLRVGAFGGAVANSTAIGYSIATTAVGQIWITGSGNGDHEVWLGAGFGAAAGYISRINGTQPGSAGTGGTMYLAGGKGGDAASAGGSVRLQTAIAGAGQTLVDRLIVAANGDISHTSTTSSSSTITGGATFAGGIGVAGAGNFGSYVSATGAGDPANVDFRLGAAGNGMYLITTNRLGFSANGVLRFEIQTNGAIIRSGSLILQDGSTGTPAITFNSEATLGLYRFGAAVLGVAGAFNINSTTSSTSPSTGGLIVGNGSTGGIGAGGSVNAGGYVTAFGGTGLSGVGTDLMRMQAAGNAPTTQFVRSSNSADKRVFEWIFNVDGQITGRLVNDAYSIATNVIQLSGSGATSTSGVVNIPGTTASTSTTTGALVVSGGAGIAGRVNIGDRTSITDLTSGNPVLDLLGLVNGGSNLRLANSSTDNTLKSAKIGTRAYVNAQTGLFIIGGDADTASNTIYIGGGTSTHQAATEVDFYTASAVNTLTGTRAGRVLSTGVLAWDFGATFAGKITNYNGLATAGNGVASIQAAGRATAQTAANASVAAYTVGAADASFIVSSNVLVTASTTHNFTVTCAYTDEGNTARTATFNFANVAGTIATAIANAGGAVPYQGVPLHIRAKAATTITVATTGTFTSVTYNAEGVITKLQ